MVLGRATCTNDCGAGFVVATQAVFRGLLYQGVPKLQKPLVTRTEIKIAYKDGRLMIVCLNGAYRNQLVRPFGRSSLSIPPASPKGMWWSLASS